MDDAAENGAPEHVSGLVEGDVTDHDVADANDGDILDARHRRL